MKAEFAGPVPVQEDPIFHVRLWRPPAQEGFAWFVDEWELTECDVTEALEWAKQRSGGKPFELSVRAAAFTDFYQLYGYPADGGGIQETVFLHTDSPT